MAVLKKFLSSLKRLFGQGLPAGRNRKKRQKTKRRAGKKLLSRLRVFRKPQGKPRPARPSGKPIKKKQKVSSAKKSLRPAPVPAVPVKLPSGKPRPPGQLIGEVTHFFSKIQVTVVKMGKGRLAVGDKIRIQGKSTDFTQTVRSMQIESVDVRSARAGELIGLKVEREARVGDKLYKLV